MENGMKSDQMVAHLVKRIMKKMQVKNHLTVLILVVKIMMENLMVRGMMKKLVKVHLMENLTVRRMMKKLVEVHLMVIILMKKLIVLIMMKEEIVAMLMVVDRRLMAMADQTMIEVNCMVKD